MCDYSSALMDIVTKGSITSNSQIMQSKSTDNKDLDIQNVEKQVSVTDSETKPVPLG